MVSSNYIEHGIYALDPLAGIIVCPHPIVGDLVLLGRTPRSDASSRVVDPQGDAFIRQSLAVALCRIPPSPDWSDALGRPFSADARKLRNIFQFRDIIQNVCGIFFGPNCINADKFSLEGHPSRAR